LAAGRCALDDGSKGSTCLRPGVLITRDNRGEFDGDHPHPIGCNEVPLASGEWCECREKPELVKVSRHTLTQLIDIPVLTTLTTPSLLYSSTSSAGWMARHPHLYSRAVFERELASLTPRCGVEATAKGEHGEA
jgi:hypothetical protein